MIQEFPFIELFLIVCVCVCFWGGWYVGMLEKNILFRYKKTTPYKMSPPPDKNLE